MRYLRYLALLTVLTVPLAYSQAQVRVGIGFGPVGVAVGPGYVAGPPVCAYGYYNYYPYGCAPYGYYGPDWFVDGVFIGAGPWYHWGHPGWFWNRGYARGWDHDDWRRGYGREGWGDHGYARGGYAHGYVAHGGYARPGNGGGYGHGYAGGGGYRGGGSFHGGGGFHGGRR